MVEPNFQWTQDIWDSEAETSERRLSTRNERMAWFGVIAVAVVAFELTADPALTVSIGCLKFGWDEFRLARWLKRTDPDRARGRVCARFYLAWGLWRISLVASATMIILGFAYAAIEGKPANGGRPPGVPPPGSISSCLLALCGFLLSAAVSTLAVISALRLKVKVWVGPEARWAREEKIWPPQTNPRRQITANRTKSILLSALITAALVAFLVILLTLLKVGAGQEVAVPVFLILFLGPMIGVPILILVLLDTLGNRMIAATPEACWGRSESLSLPERS